MASIDSDIACRGQQPTTVCRILNLQPTLGDRNCEVKGHQLNTRSFNKDSISVYEFLGFGAHDLKKRKLLRNVAEKQQRANWLASQLTYILIDYGM